MKQFKGLNRPLPRKTEPPTQEQQESVRRMLAQEPDAETLLQMLGLAPYEAAPYGRRRTKPLDQVPHGVRSTYSNHNCRCEPCRAAELRYRLRYRPSDRARANVKHGTRNAYSKHGCRCEACKRVKNTYDRERYAIQRGK